MYYDVGTFLATVICGSLLIFMCCMRSFDRKLRAHIVYMVVALIIALIMFIADDFLCQSGLPSNFRYITKIVKEIAEGFIEFECVVVMDERKSLTRTIAYSIPFIITSLIMLTAPINRVVFYFDESNNYIRGNLGYLIYVEGIVYAIQIVWTCMKKWHTGHQSDAIIIVVMVCVEILGVVLEEKKLLHSSILGCAAICVLFLYMYMYAERYNVDSVSHCYKRRCFYSDGVRYSSHTMAIISMDLNDLKQINDNYGHIAGDKALLEFANICKAQADKKFILYRTGGDEFMMLGIRATKDEAVAVVDAIKKKLEKTSYSSSFGIAMYRAGDDFDEVVVKADKAMYDDKKEYKKNNKRKHYRE